MSGFNGIYFSLGAKKVPSQNSIDAYLEIKKNGLLSRRRFQFYHVIVFYGPLTGNQAARLVEKKFRTKMSNNGFGSRLSELERQGVIEVIGNQKDEFSGMQNYLYQTTDKLPIKFDKPMKFKCRHCNGTGVIQESQGRLF